MYECGVEEIKTSTPINGRRPMETGRMKLEIGETFANCLTGRVYRVGLINKEWAVLESEDGLSQVLTGRVSLSAFYSRSGDETRRRNSKRREEPCP